MTTPAARTSFSDHLEEIIGIFVSGSGASDEVTDESATKDLAFIASARLSISAEMSAAIPSACSIK